MMQRSRRLAVCLAVVACVLAPLALPGCAKVTVKRVTGEPTPSASGVRFYRHAQHVWITLAEPTTGAQAETVEDERRTRDNTLKTTTKTAKVSPRRS